MQMVAAPSGDSVAVKSSKAKSGMQRFEYTPLDVGKRAARCFTQNKRTSIFLPVLLGAYSVSQT